MQRYFIDDLESQEQFRIIGDDFHHIVRVMRMKTGDEIICVSPNGKSAVCQIEEITDEMVVANVVKWEEGTRELPVHVVIASGLPKGDKLELIIQKGTELGAYEFVPFTASRSIVKWDSKKAGKKVERWQKIAKEAAEQSHRNIVPSVKEPVSLKQLVKLADDYTYKLIAYEEEAKAGEASVLSATLAKMEKDQSLLIVFGPEGGLTAEEVTLLTENGFLACGLGPRILRTETAPLYALSAVSYHFELLR
ncbi:16S rRNA (uracil(1498)-N(3))-methyltransferase [Mesobacillus sp. AQ2]|jgi:16S rRNA (uracil1498-N3)-methyltransferase|uniref:16S rRNA (uracil(1498)-N(3))-methyltransferase n=1 Tax=Bacillaceae TaxID=186817 RepID=UPI00119DB71C|nr:MULTISPECIES: 16S rRNA (uracil(1498)-N(3))-methyltransferase [Bacillaceae]MCM3122466.1 16S rRNA (uracil(1498)-N(3))-methyltransferase [Mesobacillus sp. MER 33]MCM3232430.1 16S rRNA (uracil(1498)-N(3))-methyltransferase [Mesobacillus sp. MER 48]WHX39366.1 16S rRNA (uracil(1498)-N(3))-methyltransferase [Mesobacillus sp. AQ2]